MNGWRYACVHCGSVKVKKVSKDDRTRNMYNPHFYCGGCNQHSKTKVDKKTKEKIEA